MLPNSNYPERFCVGYFTHVTGSGPLLAFSLELSVKGVANPYKAIYDFLGLVSTASLCVTSPWAASVHTFHSRLKRFAVCRSWVAEYPYQRIGWLLKHNTLG